MVAAPVELWRVGMYSCTITPWPVGPPFIVCVFRDAHLISQDRFVDRAAAAAHALAALRKVQPE